MRDYVQTTIVLNKDLYESNGAVATDKFGEIKKIGS